MVPVSEHGYKPEEGQRPLNRRYWASEAAAAFKSQFCFGTQKWCPEASTFASASLLSPPTQPLFPPPPRAGRRLPPHSPGTGNKNRK